MNELKFDLISPTAPVWRARRKGKPRGPRVFRFSMLPSLSVAAAMPSGVKVRIADENVEPIDLDTDADLVGISFMTFNAPRAYEIAGEGSSRLRLLDLSPTTRASRPASEGRSMPARRGVA